jgi:hypothetical protein
VKAPRLFVVLAAACVLASCTVVRMAYESADKYLHYRANQYLGLDAKGSEELEERIAEFVAWHRRNALPHYARLSDEAARRVSKGLAPGDIAWGYDALVGHARQGLWVGAERIAPLLDRLTPQQIAHMEKRFAEDNRKFARDNLRGTEADRRKRRAKRVEQRLEDWVGSLSREQRRKVQRFAERAPLYDELRERDRKRLQGELLDMIRKREAQKRLPELAANWERGRDAAYSAASEQARQEFFALLTDLDKSMTPDQRARAQANFRRYAEDFTVLARRSGDPAGR